MATRENKLYKGIVYRLTPIKEKDAMVSCIGQEGLFSFFARGVMNPTSSDFAACSVLSQSEFILNVSTQDALRLKEGTLIKSYRQEPNYSVAMASQGMLEALCKALSPEDASAFYPYVEKSFACIDEGKDPLTVLAIFLAKLLIVSGYGPTLDQCAECGKKSDIVAFSPSSGGLLCRECSSELGVEKSPVGLLKAIRAVFLVPLDKIGSFSISGAMILPLLSTLMVMVEESTGVLLKGVASLLKY